MIRDKKSLNIITEYYWLERNSTWCIVVSEILKHSQKFFPFSLSVVTSKGTQTRTRRSILTRVRFAQCVPSWAFTGHEAPSLPLQILVTSAITPSKYAFSESAFAILARKLVYEYGWPFLDYATRYRRGLYNRCINTCSIYSRICLPLCPSDNTECLKVPMLIGSNIDCAI